MRLRLGTYNVHGFRAGVDRVVRVVHQLDADALLLQETGPRRALARFAESMGLGVAADPPSAFRRRVKNAVLARPPWVLASAELERFPHSSMAHPRGMLLAELRLGPDRVLVVSVQFGLAGPERGTHAGHLLERVGKLDGLIVVGGDLNATPDHGVPTRIGERLVDVWAAAGEGVGFTFPASAPASRIDYLFVAPDEQISAVGLGGTGAELASDHLPIVADLLLPDMAGSAIADPKR